MITDDEILEALAPMLAHDTSADIKVFANIRALVQREVEQARAEERDAGDDRLDDYIRDLDERA